MAELQDDGLVRHIGVSNFDRALLERCLAIRHVDAVQNEFSLLHRQDREELLPFLGEIGVGYLAYSPLGLGMLTGAITGDLKLSDWRGGGMGETPELFRPGNLERTLELVDRLRAIAARTGEALAPMALRWVIEQSGVTAAIAGSRNPDHVRSNARAGELHLDEPTLKEIGRVFA
jgi:aryl-alcohol dehydrogenase-like predicted oxidoreductase